MGDPRISGAIVWHSQTVEPLPTGTAVAEYVIKRVLGQGGFGTTYLCFDTLLQRRCVLKEFTPHAAADRIGQEVRPKSTIASYWPDAVSGFLEEARKLARFNHPNIARIARFFEANGTAYFLMDFEEGVSLREQKQLWNTAPSERQIESLLVPLCEGIQALHRDGLIHRDIKPDNILVRPDGSPVLIDFGAAIDRKAIDAGAFFVVATPGYAPPEQFDPSLPQGPWIDVYALSATIYELITGITPVHSEDRLADDALPRVRDVANGYSDRLLTLVDRGMALDYRARPESVAELIEGLSPGDLNAFTQAAADISEKAARHFLNYARPNDGLFRDEMAALLVSFTLIDFAWRRGSGLSPRSEVLTPNPEQESRSFETIDLLLADAGFKMTRPGSTRASLQERAGDYAAAYRLDRQNEKWTYDLTRSQCARNCLAKSAEDDIAPFMELLEVVIDRARSRVKRTFEKRLRVDSID